MTNFYHAQISQGGLFSGESAILWDLDEKALYERILDKRAAGESIWANGKKFDWDSARVSIYEGPETSEIPDFSPVLGPGVYEPVGIMHNMTDVFIQGDPGVSSDRVRGGMAEYRGQNENRARIFIVHGRSEVRLHEVRRLLESITPSDAEVAILGEQSNLGRTLIEKFEGYAGNSTYAVVLLTADDEGRLVGDDAFEGRARQNVIFEMGYFYGKLGRDKVAVLKESGVSMHSDMAGVAYIPFEGAGSWELALAKELRSAGLEIDMNKLV